jgi:hypothetical protein
MKIIKYTETLLGEFDLLNIEFIKEKAKIIRFSVHFYSLIDNQWRDIMRIDNYHRSYPHIHKYYYKHKQFKEPLNINDPSKAFNFAKKYIKENAEAIKENFLNN